MLVHPALLDPRSALRFLPSRRSDDPAAPGPNLYLGICLLVTGQPAAALDPLGKAAAAGDAAYAESAQFYLAKADLALQRVDDARRALAAAAAVRGELEPEARRILAGLERLSTGH